MIKERETTHSLSLATILFGNEWPKHATFSLSLLSFFSTSREERDKNWSREERDHSWSLSLATIVFGNEWC